MASSFAEGPNQLIAIAEKDDPTRFRLYRRLSNCSPSKSTIHYHCSKCDSLARKSVEKKGHVPFVKTVYGKLVGNAHPEHYADCRAVTKDIRQLREMDRRCRAKIKSCNILPEVTEKLGEVVSQTNLDIDAGPSYYDLRPTPKRPGRLTSSHDRNELIEVELLLRFINENCVSSVVRMSNNSSIHSVGRTWPTSTNYYSVIVPEPNGMAIRIYNGSSRSVDGEEIHYYCSRCDNLCRRSGNDKESLRATLKTENDLIIDMYPAHHTQCKPVSLEALRGLGDNLKNSCIVVNHRIIPLKAVIEPESGVPHELDKSSPTGRLRHQWDAAITEDEVLSATNTALAQKIQAQQCSCKRLYEENVELYQEMLRSLDEMRTMVSDMKHVIGASDEYYIGEEQVLEEGDSNAFYVVDE